MRINIDIDDKLLNDAMQLAKTKTKKETVKVALNELVKMLKRKEILRFRGTGIWEGDLDEMRSV